MKGPSVHTMGCYMVSGRIKKKLHVSLAFGTHSTPTLLPKKSKAFEKPTQQKRSTAKCTPLLLSGKKHKYN